MSGAVVTDSTPVFSWHATSEAPPFPGPSFGVEVRSYEDDPAPTWVWGDGEVYSVRYNCDGAAQRPELTPGCLYRLGVFQCSTGCVEPGGGGLPTGSYSEELHYHLNFTVASASLTSFEAERYPWAAFAAGPDEAEVRREVFAPTGAHSGAHAMVAETSGQGIAGLRMDLPVGPTAPTGASLRSWVYVDDRTVGDASTFVGFSFSDDYPNAAAGWGEAVGWEALSATESRLQFGGNSVPLAFGLGEAGWHLVRVNHHRADDSLRVWLDGVMVADEIASGAGGEAPRWALLGALGEGMGARQTVRFDDASLTPMWDGEWPADTHLFSRLEGPEQTASGGQ